LRHVLVAQATVVCVNDASERTGPAAHEHEPRFLDPAYSPHLALEGGAATFEIAATPRIGRFD
jgi:hypothetical protein